MLRSRDPDQTPPLARALTAFWVGQLLAVTAGDIVTLAHQNALYAQLDSTALDSTALVATALLLPLAAFVAATPVAGALADRWGARRALLAANAPSAANLLVAALLAAVGLSVPAAWWGFVLVAGADKALHLAAFQTAVPLLVPARHLGRANGGRMLLTGLAGVVGLVVVGPGGEPGPGVLAAGACLVVALAAAALRWVPVPAVGPADGPLLGSFRDGWRLVAAQPGLLALLAVLGAVNVGLACAEGLLPPLTLAFAAPQQVDTVLLAGFAGLLAGTAVMVAWGGPRNLVSGIVGSGLVLAAALVAAAVRPDVGLLACSAVVFLGATPVVVGSVLTLWQRTVPPAAYGRTAAIAGLAIEVPYTGSAFLLWLLVLPALGAGEVHGPVVVALVGDGPGRSFALALMATGLVVAACVGAASRLLRPVPLPTEPR